MIEGIYFEVKSLPGSGGSGDLALHYYAKENEGGGIVLHFLKTDGTSTNIVAETVLKEDFQARFRDCSQHECQFKKKTLEEKKAEQIAKLIKMGWEHFEKYEFFAATFEFGNALKDDEKNLNAHLGKGKSHMALGEIDKAMEHFNAMAENIDLYAEEHKHTFNELGIELRKNRLFKEAVSNYNKAIGIDPQDEALHYNLARAFKEWGRPDMAFRHIKKALELKRDFREAKNFLKYLEEDSKN